MYVVSEGCYFVLMGMVRGKMNPHEKKKKKRKKKKKTKKKKKAPTT